MPLDVAGAKRPPSPTNDAPTQRVRLDRKDVSIALEYQRHIQRVTAFVVVSTTWALDTPLPCHVLQKENDTILHFSHASLEDIYIRTPWPILLGTYTAAWSDGYVLTMPTAAASRMPPIIVSTPWLALQEPVYGLACGSCGADVVRFAGPSQLRALPSEGWEELVDAWMCHGDQRLNVSVARGREDVDMHRIPAEDEVWVGTMLLKTSNAPLVPGAIDVGETTWTLQEDTYPLTCHACHVTLGTAWQKEAQQPTALHWLPCSVVASQPSSLPASFWACVLTNYLIEQTERQAVHHFLVCDMEAPSHPPCLLLWVFQPCLAIALPPRHTPVYATKLLYQRVATTPSIPHAVLTLPRHLCHALADALPASASIYPAARRALGEWHVGWLPRSWDENIVAT